MAILALFTGQGITKDLYNVLVNEVRWSKDNLHGGILHAAAFDDTGNIHAADLWASQADLDAFVSERLLPAFQKHNIPAPHVEVFPVHNIDAYPAVNEYLVS